MLKKILYYAFCACFLLFFIIYNIYLRSPLSNETGRVMFCVHVAEKLSDMELYEFSNDFYGLALLSSSKTKWIDYNIAKNIIREQWSAPLTPYKKQQVNRAIKHLDIEIKKHPDHPSILAEYAYAYQLLKNYDKAIEYYEKAINKAPKWADLMSRVAQLYNEYKMDYKKALVYIDKSIELEPNPDKYFGKAYAYAGLEQYKNAAIYYNKYLETYPDSVAVLVNVTGCEIKIKDYKMARQHLEHGLELNPYSTYLLSRKIDLLLVDHKFDEAKKESLELINNTEYDKYIGYWKLARLARRNGNNAEAEKYYNLSKNNMQEYYDKYCKQRYDMSDNDANCSNRYEGLKDFEKNKKDPTDIDF